MLPAALCRRSVAAPGAHVAAADPAIGRTAHFGDLFKGCILRLVLNTTGSTVHFSVFLVFVTMSCVLGVYWQLFCLSVSVGDFLR
jgi:hypothetical protein